VKRKQMEIAKQYKRYPVNKRDSSDKKRAMAFVKSNLQAAKPSSLTFRLDKKFGR